MNLFEIILVLKIPNFFLQIYSSLESLLPEIVTLVMAYCPCVHVVVLYQS